MAEQNNYLTESERAALENKALREHARTIETYIALTGLANMPSEMLQQGIEHVRSLNKKETKKLRKGLLQTLDLLDFLDKSEDEGRVSESITEQSTRLEQPDLGVETSPILSEPLALEPNKTKKAAGPSSFIDKLFGEIVLPDDNDVSNRELAIIIYEMAGRPIPRRNQSGMVPDMLDRIEGLLNGVDFEELARIDGSSAGSIYQWQYNIAKKIKDSYGDAAGNRFVERVNALRDIDPLVNNRLDHILDESGTQEDFDTYDRERFVKEFTELLDAHEEDEVHFINQWLTDDPDTMHIDFAIGQYRQFAYRIASRLPNDLSQLNISGNEKIVLRKLLGLYTQGGRREYKDPIPVSAQLATSKDVATTTKDLTSSIDSLLDYLKEYQGPEKARVVHETALVDQREILKNEIFSQDRLPREEWLAVAQSEISKALLLYFEQKEVDHLWNRLHFGENGEHNEEILSTTGPALRKLEKLYVDRDGKARAVTERSSSMLRMFTATFQGPQSLDLIYEKFARRSEQPITKDDVERGIVGELSELLGD